MKEDASLSVRSLASDYWFLVSPYKRLIARAIFWAFLLQVFALAEPYSIKIVIDRIQSGSMGGLLDMIQVGFVLFCFMSASGLIQVIKVWRSLLVALPMHRDLPLMAIRKLMRLSRSFHERENAGLLMGKISKGLKCTEDLTAALLFDVSSLGLQTLVAAAVIAYYDLMALCIFLIGVCIFSWLTVRFKNRMAPSRKLRHELDGTSDELMGQALMNVATVQTFAREEYECGRIEDVREDIHGRARHDWYKGMKYDYVRNAVVSAGRTAIIIACGMAVLHAHHSIGTFVLVVQLADQVFKNCYRISSVYDRMQESSEAVRRLAGVMRTDERRKDPDNPVDASIINGSVTVTKVTYHYDVRHPSNDGVVTRPALSNVSIKIAPGTHVGIVGKSGSGKSTLIKLLMGEDDPTAGSIELSDTPLHLFRREDFLQQIGYVPQEVDLFSGTIAENIAYGRKDATPEEIEAAAKAASIHRDIEVFPLKYATPVGNRGMRLSGGQRQRIGIARALLKRPQILILDEATSHVDVDTERKIQRAINKLKDGKMTMIVIAHRLSTIVNADRIIVMDGGHIVEEGTHAELLDAAGAYAALHNSELADEEAA